MNAAGFPTQWMNDAMSLQIRDVIAGYGEREILHRVSLEVARGEVVALAGPNGAGKSTLVRVISGVLRPKHGAVQWEGADLLELPPRERARLVAVVPQAHHLPPMFTVRQAVGLGRTAYLSWLGALGESDHAAVERALAQTDLLPLAERPLGHLSGGEQQRVLLARALAQETPLLLLDEPTTHLDLRHQANILGLVRRLSRARRMAVLMVVHDLNLASRFADRLALFAEGRVVRVGAPAEVLTAETVWQVYGTPVEIWRNGDGRPVVYLKTPSAPQNAETLQT